MVNIQNSIIRLRELEPEDIDFLYNTENDTSLWKISNTTKPFSKYILNEYIKSSHNDIFTSKQQRFIIETIKDNKVVGMIDLFNYDPIHLRAEVGINVIVSEQRKNYAENALSLLKKFSIDILRLNQIYCNISSNNIASIKLFEKCDYKYSGKKEQWLNTPDGFKDVSFYQLFL